METSIHSVEALHAENQILHGRLRQAEAEARLYRDKLAVLEHEFSQLKRLVFGTKSERFVPASGPDQLPLFEGAVCVNNNETLCL